MRLAIIGAGPGGLYAALRAAKQNIPVDLFEKRKVGEGIICGECIFDSLGIMRKPDQGLLHPVDELVLQGRGQYPYPLSLRRKLWMVDRRTWQQNLAARAQRLGVRIYEKVKITRERLQQMQKEYDWILDASGAPPVTSRLYHFSGDYFQEYLLSYQLMLAGNFGALSPRIKIACFPHLPARFQPAYYWIFPKDARRANVGVIVTSHGVLGRDSLDLKKMLADVLRAEGLADAPVLGKGGGVGSSRMLPRLVYGNIILIGDAAGLTSSLHGGGIDMACLSGVLAVDAVSRGHKGAARYRMKLSRYMQEKVELERVAVQKMRTLHFDDFDLLLRNITSPSLFVRFKTALRHLDMFYPTVKWFSVKKTKPDWPV